MPAGRPSRQTGDHGTPRQGPYRLKPRQAEFVRLYTSPQLSTYGNAAAAARAAGYMHESWPYKLLKDPKVDHNIALVLASYDQANQDAMRLYREGSTRVAKFRLRLLDECSRIRLRDLEGETAGRRHELAAANTPTHELERQLEQLRAEIKTHNAQAVPILRLGAEVAEKVDLRVLGHPAKHVDHTVHDNRLPELADASADEVLQIRARIHEELKKLRSARGSQPESESAPASRLLPATSAALARTRAVVAFSTEIKAEREAGSERSTGTGSPSSESCSEPAP